MQKDMRAELATDRSAKRALRLRRAAPADLAAIMQIENSGFSPAEAATRAAMNERIRLIGDTFIVAETPSGEVVGYIVGPAIAGRYLSDALFEQTRPNAEAAAAPYLSVLSLAVARPYRHHGLAGRLLAEFAKVGRGQGRRAVTLTCLERLVPFYEAHGYVNEGVSASAHAGEIWYNMVRPIA